MAFEVFQLLRATDISYFWKRKKLLPKPIVFLDIFRPWFFVEIQQELISLLLSLGKRNPALQQVGHLLKLISFVLSHQRGFAYTKDNVSFSSSINIYLLLLQPPPSPGKKKKRKCHSNISHPAVARLEHFSNIFFLVGIALSTFDSVITCIPLGN